MKAFNKLFLRSATALVSWYVNRLSDKTHRSIDTLPIFNWWKIHQNGELGYLFLKVDTPNPKGLKMLAMQKLWERVYAEYITRFGVGEGFVRMLNKKKEIAALKVEKMLSGDMSIQTLIDVCVFELDRMMKEMGDKSDFYESKAQMERMLGFTLDPRRVSVAEFYSYISTLKKAPRNGSQRQG